MSAIEEKALHKIYGIKPISDQDLAYVRESGGTSWHLTQSLALSGASSDQARPLMVMSGFTQAQVDALTAAIAQGVTTVTHNGKTVRYMNLQQMLKLRDRMITELESQPPNFARPLAFASVFLKR